MICQKKMAAAPQRTLQGQGMAEVKAKVLNSVRELALRRAARRGVLKGEIMGWPHYPAGLLPSGERNKWWCCF